MENESERIVKNVFKGASSIYSLEIFSILIILVSNVIILRLLTASDFGLLSLAMATAGLTFIGIDLGINDGLIRHISEYLLSKEFSKAKDMIVSAVILRFILAFAFSAGIFLMSETVALLYQQPAVEILMKIEAFVVFFSASNGLGYAIFFAYHKYHLTTSIMLLRQVLELIFSPLLIILGYGIVGAAFGQLIAAISCSICILVIVYRGCIPKVKGTLSYIVGMKYLLSFGLPLSVGSILGVIYNNSGKIFLGFFGTLEEIAYFSLAISFCNYPRRVGALTGRVLLPTLSELTTKTSDKFLFKTFNLSIKYITVVTYFLIGFLFLLANDLVTLLYTVKYLPAVPLIRILIFVNIIRTMGIPVGQTLKAMKKTGVFTIGSFVTFNITLILELLLIPAYGAFGAATAKTLTAFVGGFLWCFLLMKKLKFNFYISNILEQTLALILPLIFYFVFMNFLHIIFSILFFIILYPLLIIGLGCFKKDDIDRFRIVLEMFPLVISTKLARLLDFLEKIVKE